MRRLVLLVSASLAGASGLGLEVLFLSSSGLALGYGRSSAVGLSLFIAGWAVGAYGGGRWSTGNARALVCLGSVLGVLSWPALALLLWAGGSAPGGRLAQLLAGLLIASVATLQGAFLPLLARALERVRSPQQSVSTLLAASFAGGVLGAYALGQVAVAELGRSGAGLLAGAAAGAAGGLAACALRGLPAQATGAKNAFERPERSGSLSFARAGWIVGLTTAWLAGLEWIGLRLGVLWLSGMQPALTAVLCASLLALAAGAFLLPRCVPVSIGGVVALLCVCTLGATWPVLALPAMRLLGQSATALRAATDSDPLAWQVALQEVPELVRALVLVGPSLFAFGAIVPVLHRVLPQSSGASGERLGRLYLHETWGALIGIPLAHFVLVPALGLAGATGALMLAGALALAATCTGRPRLSSVAIVGVVLLALWTALRRDPALDTPPLSNPGFTLRSFQNDRDFAVAVVDDGRTGERTLLTDGFRAAGTGDEYRYMRVLGHLPILMHEHPRRVAVLALGTGTTLGSVALHPEVERIDVLEISPAVVAAAPWFEVKNRGVLKDWDQASGAPSAPRVRVLLGDGRYTLAQHPADYDVITMEPLLPDSPFAVYLYTREFYARARRALAPGGLVCQWVPPHALEAQTFTAVLDAFSASFGWSSIWLFGTQVILLGGEREPALDPARFAAADPELESALAELGIDTPRGLLARFVARSSAGSNDSGRALTDADPWIAYRPRRTGAVLLGDLPANLRALRRREGEPPASWLAAAGPDGARWLAGVRALHAAREAHARDEARLRGAEALSEPGDPDLASALARARSQCAADPELVELEHEIQFLGALRRGIAALSSDRSRAGAEAALPDLLQAAELKRERCDVHLYMATALSRMGSPAAPKALEAALTRCPRAAQTAEGRRARELGLAQDLWHRAESAADAAVGPGP